MDIDGWLRRIGLEQYTQTFRDNAIDDDVLRDLTDDHLRELGLPLGARLRLLKAVAALGTIEQPKVSLEIKPTVPRTDAERRQLTVMFVDLVGSTALSARLDPEDMREIVGAYHRSCAEQITKAGGVVAKYMGDGVLAYFGYPQAHEHDAERAVLAGLALVEAVPKLTTAVSTVLQVRIGIATGLVVVGDLIGSGEAQERGIVGDTPNLAARLQALAEPNMVVIADSTRRLLGNLFELRDLGARDLKGIAGPVRAWAALRANSVESRFEALHMTGLAALVGREEESELLMRRWSRAKSGEGQVVLLSGEAGHRQIAAHGGPSGMPRRRTAYAPALFLLPAAHGQRSLSHHRPDAACRGAGARRRMRKRSSTSSMPYSHRPRPRSRMPRSLPRCCRSRTMDVIPRWT